MLNRRSVKPSFIAPDVEEARVLKFSLTTKERFINRRNRKRIFRSIDFIDVIVLPKVEVVVEPIEPTVPNIPVENNPNQITFKGFSYLSVSSSLIGRIWLDRNLGATQVCSTPSDISCFWRLVPMGTKYRRTPACKKRV